MDEQQLDTYLRVPVVQVTPTEWRNQLGEAPDGSIPYWAMRVSFPGGEFDPMRLTGLTIKFNMDCADTSGVWCVTPALSRTLTETAEDGTVSVIYFARARAPEIVQ